MNLRILGYVFLSLFFSANLAAQPSAVIQTEGSSAFCLSGTAQIKITFSGLQPFGYALVVYSPSIPDGVIYLRTSPIQSNSIVESIPINETTRFELYEVYDGSMLLSDWQYGKGYKNVSGSATVQIDQLYTPLAGPDIQDLCGYQASLSGSPQNSSHSVYWSALTPGSFSDANAPSTLFTSNSEGTFQLVLNEVNGACIGRDTMNVEFLGSPKGALSGNSVICKSGNLPVQTVLTGNGPWSYTLSNGVDAPIERSNISEATDNLSIPVTGAQSFHLIQVSDKNGCLADPEDLSGSAFATDEQPFIYAGEDKTICGKIATLEGTSDKGVVLWSTLNAGTLIDVPSDLNSTVSAGDFETVVFHLNVNNNGCISEDEVALTFDSFPGLILAADADTICVGNQAYIPIELTGDQPWTVDYSYNGNNFQEVFTSASSGFSLNPSISTSYQLLKVSSPSGCSSDINDEFNIQVDQIPTANPGPDSDVCGIGSVVLNASLSIGDGGFWSGPGVFSDIYSFNSEYIPGGYGTEVLTWTEVNGKCSDQATVSYTFEIDTISAHAGADAVIYMSRETVLSAEIPYAGEGTWSYLSGNGIFQDIHSSTSSVSDLMMGDNVFLWTVKNGTCQAQSDEVVVTVKNLLNPSGFSPDGDGINDFFVIEGATQIQDSELIVFDINGKVVFRKANYQNDWAGTDLSDKKLEDGTYYYVFTGNHIDAIKDYLIIRTVR